MKRLTLLDRIKEFFSIEKHRERIDDTILGELTTHPIFNELQTWLVLKIDGLDIEQLPKKKMAISYLKIYFTTLETTLIKFAVNYNDYFGKPNSCKLKKELLCTLENVYKKCEGEGIPRIFIEKINKTNIKYFDMIINTMNDIINQSNFYLSHRARMASIFDILLFYLRIMTSELEQIINNMNGELKSALEGTLFDESIN